MFDAKASPNQHRNHFIANRIHSSRSVRIRKNCHGLIDPYGTRIVRGAIRQAGPSPKQSVLKISIRGSNSLLDHPWQQFLSIPDLHPQLHLPLRQRRQRLAERRRQHVHVHRCRIQIRGIEEIVDVGSDANLCSTSQGRTPTETQVGTEEVRPSTRIAPFPGRPIVQPTVEIAVAVVVRPGVRRVGTSRTVDRLRGDIEAVGKVDPARRDEPVALVPRGGSPLTREVGAVGIDPL